MGGLAAAGCHCPGPAGSEGWKGNCPRGPRQDASRPRDDPDGKRVFFTLAGVDSLQVLDTTSKQIVAQIPVGASPHYAPFTPDGRWALAVVQGPGESAILDMATTTVAGVVPVGKAPHWSTSSSDGRTAYVTNEATNDVSVVDLTSRRVVATIP